MPKYLVQARYTAEGLKGLIEDSGSGRRADVQAAVKSVGGKVDCFYYAFGEDDAFVIVDVPNHIAAAALAINVSRTGTVRIRTTPLLTVEDVDRALQIEAKYRAPGE